MASPVIAGSTTTNDSGLSGTSFAADLPSGVVSGDLIVVILTVDRISGTPIDWPVGWVELYDTVSGTNITGAMAYKVSDGTEGSSVTITISSAQQACSRSYRITGHDSSAEANTSAISSSTSQTPPSITPSYGSRDYLFIAVDHVDTYLYTINTFPSGYGNTSDLKSGSGGARCGLGTCDRQATVTTETPTNFILSIARTGLTSTIAIPAPSAGGGGLTASITESKASRSNSSSLLVTPAVVNSISIIESRASRLNSSSVSFSIDLAVNEAKQARLNSSSLSVASPSSLSFSANENRQPRENSSSLFVPDSLFFGVNESRQPRENSSSFFIPESISASAVEIRSARYDISSLKAPVTIAFNAKNLVKVKRKLNNVKIKRKTNVIRVK